MDLDDTHIGFQTTLYPIEEISEGPAGNNVRIEELHNVDPTLVVRISSVEHCPSHWFEVVQVPATTGSVSKGDPSLHPLHSHDSMSSTRNALHVYSVYVHTCTHACNLLAYVRILQRSK